MTIKNVEAGKYNAMLAVALEKEYSEFEKPEWIDFVKTGNGKVRPNAESNFWHKRAASMLRQIYFREIVGVERLRTRYGNRKKRGNRPEEFRKAGGKIIRLILQQAEKAGLVEKSKGKKAGRQLTSSGKKFLEELAGEK